MITNAQLAKIFEDGLNEHIKAIDENLAFKVWAEVGEYETAVRQGNEIYEYINAGLNVNYSKNDTSAIVAGSATLALAVLIPFNQPKTSAKQTKAELEEIRAIPTDADGGTMLQIAFPNLVIQAIDDYFQAVQSFTLQDLDGTEYGIGISAGKAQVVSVDTCRAGRAVNVVVYADMIYVQGGDISQMITLTMLGVTVPYNAQKISRTKEWQRSIQGSEDVSASIATSSALAIDLQLPADGSAVANSIIKDILGDKLNMSFFVRINWAKKYNAYYLMTYMSNSASMQGILGAGLTTALIEALPRPELLAFPAGYRVGYYTLTSSDVSEQTIILPSHVKVTFYIAGKVYSTTLILGTFSVPITPQDLSPDAATGNYRLYIVEDGENIKDINITWLN